MNNKTEQVLHIEGEGYSRIAPKKSELEKTVIPKHRSFVSSIGSKVFFSIEEIDFGELLPGKVLCIFFFDKQIYIKIGRTSYNNSLQFVRDK